MRKAMGLQGESTLSDDEKRTEAKRHVEYLLDFFEQMDERERRFINDLAERFEQYGGSTFVSNKQLFWLRDIAEKY